MKSIGKYQLIRKIGVGGMATVYLVRDMLMDQYFAMKVLHQQYSDNDTVCKRFIREARLQINLNHPNIVRCFDVNYEDGYYYILLEYVNGPSLARILKERNSGLPVEIALSLFIQILAGINHAHRQNVIHRDIKPHNILIANYQGSLTETSVAKIGDFGIAKALEESSHTSTGARLGTIYYMSPEQIVSSSKVDHRTDIYSLGITLYQMLTGRLPYRATSSEFSMMEVILKEEIVPPRELRSDIPEWLVDIIFKATAKQPEDRFQSGEEMMAAIREGLSSGEAAAPSAPPPSSRERKEAPAPAPEEEVKTPDLAPEATPEPKASAEPKEPPKPAPEPTPETKQKKKQPSRTVHVHEKKESRFGVLVTLVLLVLLLSGAAAGYFLYWKNPVVPDVTGKKWLVAERMLKQRGFITEKKFDYHLHAPAGTVFKVEPAPGNRLHAETPVKMWVSKGPQEVIVPKVVSLSLSQALDKLENLGLRVRRVKKVVHNNRADGTVQKIVPSAGTVKKNGDGVTLFVNYNPNRLHRYPAYFSHSLQDVLSRLKWVPGRLMFEEDFSGKSAYSWFWTVPAPRDKAQITEGKLLLAKYSHSGSAFSVQIPVEEPLRNLVMSVDLERLPAAENAVGGVYLELESGAYFTFMVDLKNGSYFVGLFDGERWTRKMSDALNNFSRTGTMELARFVNRVSCFWNNREVTSLTDKRIQGYAYPGLVVIRSGSQMYFDNIRIHTLE